MCVRKRAAFHRVVRRWRLSQGGLPLRPRLPRLRPCGVPWLGISRRHGLNVGGRDDHDEDEEDLELEASQELRSSWLLFRRSLWRTRLRVLPRRRRAGNVRGYHVRGCRGCDLKHILCHSERHGVLTSSTLTAAQEGGGSGSLL